MINLKKSDHNMQWSIIAGMLLLVIAFFIIITSNNNTNAQKESFVNETTSPKPEESTTNIFQREKITEEVTEEPETKENVKKQIDFDAEYPYLIRINRAENFGIVYGMDKKGHHSIPYKAFICSTGLEEDDTPLGVFEMSDKYRWRLMVDGTYAQYAIRIQGQIMLHSVPYTEPDNDSLEFWEYNKLGKPASLGCVRFRVAAIKWIYDHCKAGTKVNIYSEPGEIPPITLPTVKKIKKSNPKSGWDPTDPVEGNPWKEKKTKKSQKYKKKKQEQTTEKN